MFSGRPSVRASVRDSRGSFMFPRYLQYLLTDFCQTFVTGASWDTDDLITFWGQKVKVQGRTIAAEAHSTRCYCCVQLFLVSSSDISRSTIVVKLKLCVHVQYDGRLTPILDSDPNPAPGSLGQDQYPHRQRIAFIPISGCCRSCAEDLSDEGTLRAPQNGPKCVCRWGSPRPLGPLEMKFESSICEILHVPLVRHNSQGSAASCIMP